MKINFISLIVVCFSFGCSHQEPKTVVTYNSSSTDYFDKCTTGVVDTSHYVWAESKNAYVWIVSDENKDRANKALDFTKELANTTYVKVMKTYNEHK